MANWWDEYTWKPSEWIAPEYFLVDQASQAYIDFIALDNSLAIDDNAQSLFFNSMYNMDISAYDRDMIRIELYQYMLDEYDIDFADVFDWEGYRAWYDNK